MKTPEEKARELIIKYAELKITTTGCVERGNPCIITNVMFTDSAKQCALIAVDEILEATKDDYQIQYTNGEWSREVGFKYSEYWQQVKTAIETL